MSPNNAYLGKAILTGSGLVAIAIVVAALVLPDAAVKPVQAAKGNAEKSVSAPRYEIIKIENGASWTLDRKTGVITMCKVRDEHMVCAGSGNATQMPSATPEQLEKKRVERRQERRAERKEAFNQFFTFFERVIKFAEKHDGKGETNSTIEDSEQL
ncbi:MAG: hypothetical protein GKS01_14495 [Alphaproteobacteria bacterium]|nr:hypothetical protein [Alphaproteobacteria bacterium]